MAREEETWRERTLEGQNSGKTVLSSISHKGGSFNSETKQDKQRRRNQSFYLEEEITETKASTLINCPGFESVDRIVTAIKERSQGKITLLAPRPICKILLKTHRPIFSYL
ncbi:hypothetical protein L798_01824 [Zootermopsis nevadensis]|uniref:Uncharacterized protein n=1 Tax=Zootermopsis nevadensis TaxID=136037 RepID=A0A067RGS8_ZOONE|nr:hypothetical protein L798_01824 [Zootermopsis nevadensis]